MGKYRTILIDPPWPVQRVGRFADPKHSRPDELPYQTMAIDQIEKLPVGELAAESCHVWLWTTNQFLHDGFHMLQAWGFRYLAPITWVKPSGFGAWWAHRTQTLLMGYRRPCVFARGRFRATVLTTGQPRRHSDKPAEAYELIEAVSESPRVELFARAHRAGWDVWGDEVRATVKFAG